MPPIFTKLGRRMQSLPLDGSLLRTVRHDADDAAIRDFENVT